jgi:hypothetical protein
MTKNYSVPAVSEAEGSLVVRILFYGKRGEQCIEI